MAISAMILATGLALWSCGSGGGPDGPDAGAGATKVPAVEAVPARFGSLPLEEVLSGVVRARDQVAVRPEISAMVVEVLVRDGDSVRRGQPLVRLNDDTLREQLAQSQASLRLAEAAAAEARARLAEITARVTRTRVMAGEGLVSDLDLETQEAQRDAATAQADQATARVEQARATVEERRSAMDRTVVCSPVEGRVGRRGVEVGMLVNPATLLFLVGGFDQLIIEVSLTQSMLETVGVGTPVVIKAGRGAAEPLLAEISRISPFLERSSFSTTAEIDAANQGDRLRPGMYVTVRLNYGSTDEAALVPLSAIREVPETGETRVYVIIDPDGLTEPQTPGTDIPEEPRRVALRPVVVLAEGRGTAGVRGVEEGEWVVTLGQQLLDEARRTAGADTVPARVRPTSWKRVLGLSALQREDLLETFLDKQQRLARVLGAELPETREAVDDALRAAEASAAQAPAAPGGGS